MIIPEWLTELNFAFSQRDDGQMSFKRAEPHEVTAARYRFLENRGLDLDAVVSGELPHGSEVALVSGRDIGKGARERDWIKGVDGLVTDKPGVLLMTTHADCAPLIIYDRSHRILGQAHAGWRGLVSGVVENLVDKLKSVNGTNPSDLHAWIGPTIRACCYEVDLDVAERFPLDCRILAGESIRLDLTRFIHLELFKLGFDPDHVTDCNICTSCDERFSSYRRDGDDVQAMACLRGLPGKCVGSR